MSEFSLLEPYLSFCIIEAWSENIATPLAVKLWHGRSLFGEVYQSWSWRTPHRLTGLLFSTKWWGFWSYNEHLSWFLDFGFVSNNKHLILRLEFLKFCNLEYSECICKLIMLWEDIYWSEEWFQSLHTNFVSKCLLTYICKHAKYLSWPTTTKYLGHVTTLHIMQDHITFTRRPNVA